MRTTTIVLRPISDRASLWVRFLLAGPGVLLLTVLVVAAGPKWLPAGRGGVDHIVLPLLLTPAVWAALFFYALLDRSLMRTSVVLVAVAGLQLFMLRGLFVG